jgi:hypothetical protein
VKISQSISLWGSGALDAQVGASQGSGGGTQRVCKRHQG